MNGRQHSKILTGFFRRVGLASGVREGIQKLGRLWLEEGAGPAVDASPELLASLSFFCPEEKQKKGILYPGWRLQILFNGSEPALSESGTGCEGVDGFGHDVVLAGLKPLRPLPFLRLGLQLVGALQGLLLLLIRLQGHRGNIHTRITENVS